MVMISLVYYGKSIWGMKETLGLRWPREVTVGIQMVLNGIVECSSFEDLPKICGGCCFRFDG